LVLRSVSPDSITATIGASFNLELLWEIRCLPASDVALRFFLEDKTGLRELAYQSVDSAYPPTRWRPGQRVRTYSRLRLPANQMPGKAILEVEASDPVSGQPFGRRWGPLPLPGRQKIATLSLTTRPHETQIPNLAYRSDANFGGQIRLLGYDIVEDDLATGGSMTITLAWQAVQSIETNYSVFLHLLDARGQIVAQRDMVPRNGELPTNVWLPGEVVVDSYILQTSHPLTSGNYTLITGFYDPFSWRRLPVVGSTLDFASLQSITIVPQ
jgi:hypothetical protein